MWRTHLRILKRYLEGPDKRDENSFLLKGSQAGYALLRMDAAIKGRIICIEGLQKDNVYNLPYTW